MMVNTVIDLFLINLFIFFSSFTPVFAYLINKMKFLDNKDKAYTVFISSLLISIFIIGFFYPVNYEHLDNSRFSAPIYTLMLYPIFIVLFSLILKLKFKKEYSKIIALSLMLGFILTEIHELLAFIQEYIDIGIVNIHVHPYHFLTHIATISYFVLAVKTAKLKFSIYHIYSFMLVLSLSYACYMVDPYLDFTYNPVTKITTFSVYNYLNRFLWFGWLAHTFYDGSGRL